MGGGGRDATRHPLSPHPQTRPAETHQTLLGLDTQSPRARAPQAHPQVSPQDARCRGEQTDTRTHKQTDSRTRDPPDRTIPSPQVTSPTGGLHYTPNSTPSQPLDPAPGRAGLRGGETETHPGAPRLGPSAPFFCSPRLVLKLSSGVSSLPGVGSPRAPPKKKIKGVPVTCASCAGTPLRDPLLKAPTSLQVQPERGWPGLAERRQDRERRLAPRPPGSQVPTHARDTPLMPTRRAAGTRAQTPSWSGAMRLPAVPTLPH